MFSKEEKTNEELQQQFDNAINAFHDTYPDIYKYSSDREIASCLLLNVK